jgi:dolichol-phosphate mannosyltransferase
MNSLIVLPSYNESQNINKLINEILVQDNKHFIVVVDDNSPDDTIAVIKNFLEKKEYKNRVHLIKRSNKLGRGSAVLEGFKWGLENLKETDVFIEMDCDFSHSPEEIYKGQELIKNHNIAIGARYPNGTIINWPIKRRVFSYFANQLIRLLINRKIYDYTNGFRFYSKESVKYLLTKNITSSGYICLSETIAILLKGNFTIASFPIVFNNRIRGESNFNFKEIIVSLMSIMMIAWKFRFKNFN